MKQPIRIGCILLILTLMLCGCGKSAPDAVPENIGNAAQAVGAAGATEPAQHQEDSEDTIPVDSLEPEAPDATPAITKGNCIYTTDSDWMLLDGDSGTDWFITSWLEKGYGSGYCAVNPVSGQVIEGEEGAEVVLCGDGIIQFVWRYTDGSQVPVEDVYFYEGDDPQEVTLFAVFYDFDGTVIEERAILTMLQSAEDPYYSTVWPAMEQAVSEFGGGEIGGNAQMLSVSDDSGDAVVYDDDGTELLRLPGVDASMTYAFLSSDGTVLSVYRPDTNQTEFYRFD